MRSPIQVRTQKKQSNQKNSSDSNANKPSSSSGNLRIKVRLSDNRTDIMELAKGTAVKSLKRDFFKSYLDFCRNHANHSQAYHKILA